MSEEKIELEELYTWNGSIETYFLELLNKEVSIDEMIENIKSFRNSKWYTGTNEKFKEVIE